MASELTFRGRVINRAYFLSPEYGLSELTIGVYKFIGSDSEIHCIVDGERADVAHGRGGTCKCALIYGYCKHGYGLPNMIAREDEARRELALEAKQERAAAAIAQQAAARRLYQKAQEQSEDLDGCGWGADRWKAEQQVGVRLDKAA